MLLVAMVGLAGAGKTTAAGHLEKLGLGHRFYVGGVLRDELRRLGSPATAENERAVRANLRRDHGDGVFAVRALPGIETALMAGPVLLDAIYCEDERRVYADAFGDALILVAIEASQALRAERLARRRERPMTRDQLEIRDRHELSTLGLGEVALGAQRRLANSGSLADLERSLDQLVSDLSAACST